MDLVLRDHHDRFMGDCADSCESTIYGFWKEYTGDLLTYFTSSKDLNLVFPQPLIEKVV